MLLAFRRLSFLAAAAILGTVAVAQQDGEVADWDYVTPDITYDQEMSRGESGEAPTLSITQPFQRESRAGNVVPTDWSRVPADANYYADFYAASPQVAVSPFYKGGALIEVEDDIGDHLSL